MADRRRMERVNGVLREEIAALIASQVNDPRLRGIITITQVRTASDLRSARVYVSVMGTEVPDRKPWPGYNPRHPISAASCGAESPCATYRSSPSSWTMPCWKPIA